MLKLESRSSGAAGRGDKAVVGLRSAAARGRPCTRRAGRSRRMWVFRFRKFVILDTSHNTKCFFILQVHADAKAAEQRRTSRRGCSRFNGAPTARQRAQGPPHASTRAEPLLCRAAACAPHLRRTRRPPRATARLLPPLLAARPRLRTTHGRHTSAQQSSDTHR